jgi:hypothetical protein
MKIAVASNGSLFDPDGMDIVAAGQLPAPPAVARQTLSPRAGPDRFTLRMK